MAANPTVFISYRRRDSTEITDLISEKLESRFGRQRIFRDIDGIPFGVNFKEHIDKQLEHCKVALIIIGPDWVSCKDENGVRRLDNEADFVRHEVAAALSRTPSIPCIPVLVGGATMPTEQELPDDLKDLGSRNALEIKSGRYFKQDIESLVQTLNPTPMWKGICVRAALCVCLLAVALGLVFGGRGKDEPKGHSVTPDTSPKWGEQWRNSLRMEFVPIPGSAILFGVHETRIRDYLEFAKSTNRVMQAPDFGTIHQQSANEPVVDVSWIDASEFCKWLTELEQKKGILKESERYRLPTDREWSRAVGLSQEKTGSPKEKSDQPNGEFYPWGAWPPPDRCGNYGGKESVTELSPRSVEGTFQDDHRFTSIGGAYSGNSLGIFDLGGNVWEWCESLYDEPSGNHRVLRGGSWNNVTRGRMTSTFRNHDPPEATHNNVGFRCVLDLSAD